MKYRIMLKALSSLQAQTNVLRIYVKIVVKELGKLGQWRSVLSGEVVFRKKIKFYN